MRGVGFGLVVTGQDILVTPTVWLRVVERQGAVVNCRFDPTLHNRGLILRGVRVSPGITRIDFHAHLLGYSPVQGRRL